MDINKEFEDWWDRKGGIFPLNMKASLGIAFKDGVNRANKAIPNCITQQGTTIGKTGADVIIQCTNADEAIEVLDWLTEL